MPKIENTGEAIDHLCKSEAMLHAAVDIAEAQGEKAPAEEGEYWYRVLHLVESALHGLDGMRDFIDELDAGRR
jgi:tellurite resistance protein